MGGGSWVAEEDGRGAYMRGVYGGAYRSGGGPVKMSEAGFMLEEAYMRTRI